MYADIPSEPLPVLAEPLVERVVGHSGEECLDRIEQVVLVALVFLVEESPALFADLVPARVALGLEDITGFEQDLADVCVQLAEPCAQGLIPLGIIIESTSRVEDGVHAAAVGEALEKSTELRGSGAESGIVYNALVNKCETRASGTG